MQGNLIRVFIPAIKEEKKVTYNQLKINIKEELQK
jgi:hypothetical protein